MIKVGPVYIWQWNFYNADCVCDVSADTIEELEDFVKQHGKELSHNYILGSERKNNCIQIPSYKRHIALELTHA